MTVAATPATQTSESARIYGLDVLRGLAALAVLFSHYINYWDRYLGDVPVLAPGRYGYYAVELFFVISGIVIFNTLEKCRSVAHFAYLRFSRLYPIYWVSLWLVALASWWLLDQSIWWGGLVLNTTMFQEFLGYGYFDNVYWSLTVELAFYLNVAWLFALGWHRRVMVVCAVWLTLSCLWEILAGPSDGDSRGPLALLFAFDYSPFFVFGIVLYDAARYGAKRSTFVMLAFALLTATFLSGMEGLIVAAAVLALPSLAMFGRLNALVNPFTLWVGNVSFSLYLVHRNVGYQLLPELHRLGLGPVLSIALMTVLALAMAALLTYAVERPALAYLRLLNRWAWGCPRGC